MNKPLTPSEDADRKIGLFFDPAEKVIETFNIELDKIQLFVCIHFGQKNGTKLEWNSQIFKNLAKVIFGYENQYIYFRIILYSTEVNNTLL